MLAQVRFSHTGQQPDPETVEQAFHLFSTEGYLVLPEIFPTALIDKLHSSFLATYSRYCTHENHTDALLAGNRRVMVTVRLEGPFNDPLLYAHPLVLPILQRILRSSLILSRMGW